MRKILTALALLLAASTSYAEGFAVKDLSGMAPEMQAALGKDFVHRAAPNRVTISCPTCSGTPMIDVLLGRQDDGTEQRVRSGETKISQLEALCKQRNPQCTLAALDVKPAVGWITTYRMGQMAGSTAVILRDGDLLTIRSIAEDDAMARVHAETLVKTVGGKIIGAR